MFLDFVFTRMEDVRVMKTTQSLAGDCRPRRAVEPLDGPRLIPHPDHPRPEIVRRDYEMPDGVLKVRVRAANAGYASQLERGLLARPLRYRGDTPNGSRPACAVRDINAAVAPGYVHPSQSTQKSNYGCQRGYQLYASAIPPAIEDLDRTGHLLNRIRRSDATKSTFVALGSDCGSSSPNSSPVARMVAMNSGFASANSKNRSCFRRDGCGNHLDYLNDVFAEELNDERNNPWSIYNDLPQAFLANVSIQCLVRRLSAVIDCHS